MQDMQAQEQETSADVMPIAVVTAAGIGWLLLFGIRSIMAPMLLFMGPDAAVKIADLDRGPLLRVYLILLSLMVLIGALRAARTAESGSKRRSGRSKDGTHKA